MKGYDNGAATRQAIIEAACRLYYQNGFHATNYRDICSMAHIDRSTFYYHFQSKEELRCEVELAYMEQNKRIAQRYCTDNRYHYFIAMAMLWVQSVHDTKLRLFLRECCENFPVFTGKRDPSHFYYAAAKLIWEPFWDYYSLPQLTFASNYGYIISTLMMLFQDPEQYDPMEVFFHCVHGYSLISEFPESQVTQILQNVNTYVGTIPKEYLHSFAMCLQPPSQ